VVTKGQLKDEIDKVLDEHWEIAGRWGWQGAATSWGLRSSSRRFPRARERLGVI